MDGIRRRWWMEAFPIKNWLSFAGAAMNHKRITDELVRLFTPSEVLVGCPDSTDVEVLA
jgi:hypothetical protein